MRILDWLLGSAAHIAPYLSNVDRITLYHVRTAIHRAAHPADFQARYMAGLAIQARLSRPKIKRGANVLTLPRKKA